MQSNDLFLFITHLYGGGADRKRFKWFVMNGQSIDHFCFEGQLLSGLESLNTAVH